MSIVLSLMGAVVTATPAAAAPGSDLLSDLTSEKWSDELRWAVMGTDEFDAMFAQDGCTSPNMGAYTQLWTLNAPAIMGELQNKTGEVVLTQFPGLTNGLAPVQDWEHTSSIPYVSSASTGTVWSLGEPLKFRDPANPFREMAAATWPCFETMAQFAKNVRDDGGVEWFTSPNAVMPWPDTVNGSGAAADAAQPPSSFWWKYSGGAKPAEHAESGHDFKVSEGQFCDAAGINPLCATATFLQCPAASEAVLPTGTAQEQAAALPADRWARTSAAMNCLIWNHNVLQYNAWLKYHLMTSVGENSISSPNWDYAQLIVQGNVMADTEDQVKVMAWVAAAVGIAAGILISGGGLLLAILGVSAVAITAAGAWDEVWGAVVCSSELGKCMGRLAAEGLAFGAEMVSDTANSVEAPQLNNSTGVYNTLAAVSAIIMFALLFLGLAWSIFTAKFGQLLQLSFGLVRWGVAIGLGSTLLTMAFGLSDMVANAIAGAGGTGRQLNQFAGSIAEASMNMGLIEGFVGWIFFIIAALVGMVASLIVWVVMNVSYGFIGLAVALMILQMAGTTGGPGLQKWITRGWGLFWTILLLKPAITVVAVMVPLSGGDDPFRTIIVGVTLLVVCALAPMLIVQMFPVMSQGGLGVMAALANSRQAGGLIGGAGKALGGGASMIGGLSRSEGLQSFLSAIRGGGSAVEGGSAPTGTDPGSGKGSGRSKPDLSKGGTGQPTGQPGSQDQASAGTGTGTGAGAAEGQSTQEQGTPAGGQGEAGRERPQNDGAPEPANGPTEQGTPSNADTAEVGHRPADSAVVGGAGPSEAPRPPWAAGNGKGAGSEVPAGTGSAHPSNAGANDAAGATPRTGAGQPGPSQPGAAGAGSGGTGQNSNSGGQPVNRAPVPPGPANPRTAARDAAVSSPLASQPAVGGPASRNPPPSGASHSVPVAGRTAPPARDAAPAPESYRSGPTAENYRAGSSSGEGAPGVPWRVDGAPTSGDGESEPVVPRWVSPTADLDSRDVTGRDEV